MTLVNQSYVLIAVTGLELSVLAVVGILGSYGRGLVTHGYTMAEAGYWSPSNYSRVAYAEILGYLLFGEIPGPWNCVGMALIVALAGAKREKQEASGCRAPSDLDK